LTQCEPEQDRPPGRPSRAHCLDLTSRQRVAANVVSGGYHGA